MLFFSTALLAAFTIGLTWVSTRRWLTLATLYWLGWLIGIPAAQLAASVDLTPVITPAGQQVILLTHLGAALGFTLVALISFRARSLTPQSRLSYNGLVWLIVGLQAAFGLGLLASRVASSGLDIFSIRTDYLADAYLVENLPPEYRLYNYLQLIALAPSMLIAAQDRGLGRISWASLGCLFLAAAPGGISTGGRIWILQTVSIYFISYLLSSGPHLNVAQAAKRGAQTLLAIAILVSLFTAFGNVRDTSRGELLIQPPSEMPSWVADQIQAYSPLIYYLGVPTAAAGAYSAFNAEAFGGASLGGQLTFPFVFAQFQRFGVGGPDLNRDYTAAQRDWIATTVDRRIGTTHATITSLLVGDFGESNLLVAAFITFFGLQLLFVWCAATGGVWHLVATVLGLYGGLLAFQDGSFGTASAFIPIIAVLVMRALLRKNWWWGNTERM